MNKLIHLIPLFSLVILSTSTMASEKNIIPPTNTDAITIPKNIHYLSMGPRYMSSKSLRVSIIIEEIYPFLFIEEFIFGDVEGDPDIIVNSYLLSGFDITKKLGSKKRTRLNITKSIKWHQWNVFEMKHNKTKFKIQYNAENEFKIEEIK